jgi:hypothetical protein
MDKEGDVLVSDENLKYVVVSSEDESTLVTASRFLR